MRLVVWSVCAVAAIALLYPPHPPESTEPGQIQARLARQFDRAEPRSEEAASIARDIARARRKSLQTEPRAQDPGAFREALAGIKTTPEGTTYAPDYKRREIARAIAGRKATAAPLPWIERGPGNVSGRGRAIVVDPGDPTSNTWFVATVGGGIWKTTNGGASWVDKTPELTTLSTTCLAMCLSQPDVMYTGTGMGYGRIVDLEGSGIWKTTDRGETWTQLASTSAGQILTAINRIVVDPSDPDILVVCSNTTYSHLSTKGGERVSGIFRSTDGGASWVQTFDPDAVFGTTTDNRVQQIVADPTDFSRLYATVNEVGVIRSVDAGLTWTVSADNFAYPSDIGQPTGGGFGLAGISVRTEMAIAPSDPMRLYAAVERPRGVADLYVSADGGDTWSLTIDTSGDPNWFNAYGQSGATSYQAGWFDNTIAVHPFDEDIVFVGGVNLYRLNVNPSNNQRASTVIGWWLGGGPASYVHADHHWLEIVPINEAGGQFWILDANDGGIGVSKNSGGSFTQVTGMGTTQFYGADKAPGVDRYSGGMQDNGTWASGVNPGAGTSWSGLLGGDGFEVAFHGTDGSKMLYGYQFNGIVRSTDGGFSNTPVADANFPTIFGASGAPFITKIANDKTDPDLVFIVGSTGVRRSDDFGLSWTEAALTPNWIGWRPFDNVEISIADPQVVWATSRMDYDPASRRIGGIHVSDDGGLSFTHISSNLPADVFESSGIGTHPVDGQTAYILFSLPGRPKILRTTDLGATFEDLSGFSGVARTGFSGNGFPDVAVFSLLVMPFDTDIIWAGTEIGLFVSDDGGISWQFADNGLPAVAIFQLRIVEDEIIVATQGRGVWSVSLPELAGHQPPVATLAPRLNALVMSPAGYLPIDIDLRSAYDSTQVWVDGALLQTLPANPSVTSEMITMPVNASGTVTAQVRSFVDERIFRSPERSGQVYPVDVVAAYTNDFSDNSRDHEFTGTGFQMTHYSGFVDRAMHSVHPYSVSSEVIMQLLRPIRVQDSAATLQYSDVVLVEKGTATSWTDPNFWDYVVVEGTLDGANWVPLAPGYDSRANPVWSSAYDNWPSGDGGSNAVGNGSMLVTHTIDLLETFDPGDTIFVRFRLFSDPGVVAWGWAIDDIVIQPTGVGIADQGSGSTPGMMLPALGPNVPNPFNPSTEISYSVPTRTRVDLVVYDLAGRMVKRLVSAGFRDPGEYRVEWDGRDDQGRAVSSGVYLYQLRTDEFERTRKMTLLK